MSRLKMDWRTAKQVRQAITVSTVSDLIAVLQKCPQDWPVCNPDECTFAGIMLANDGTNKLVELY